MFSDHKFFFAIKLSKYLQITPCDWIQTKDSFWPPIENSAGFNQEDKIVYENSAKTT